MVKQPVSALLGTYALTPTGLGPSDIASLALEGPDVAFVSKDLDGFARRQPADAVVGSQLALGGEFLPCLVVSLLDRGAKLAIELFV
jgi:hypothetical protein